MSYKFADVAKGDVIHMAFVMAGSFQRSGFEDICLGQRRVEAVAVL